jgi:ribosomal protein S1
MSIEAEWIRSGMIIETTVSEVRQGSLTLVAAQYTGHLPAPEISWNPGECDTSRFRVGDSLRVYVVAVEYARFSASLRLLFPECDPWRIAEKLSVGQLVRGTVVRCWSWGAEVNVDGELSVVWVFRGGEQTVVGAEFSGRISLLDHELRKVEVRPC